MSLVLHCDRCDNPITGAVPHARAALQREGESRTDWDLCLSCAATLERWVTGVLPLADEEALANLRSLG